MQIALHFERLVAIMIGYNGNRKEMEDASNGTIQK